jgi:hypothetical protein
LDAAQIERSANSMQLIIDNHDGMGQQDYSAYLDAEHLPKLKRRLNRAEEMQAWLASTDAGFRVPASGARVTLQRDDGYKLFTGYLTAAPQQQYLGSAQAGSVWRYGLAAIDDSWLLDHNAPTARTPFVYRTAGDGLRTITNDVLPGVLDVSGVQGLGYVNQYEASSQASWSELAQDLATRERACYRAHDGKLTFHAVGQLGFTIDEQDAKFSPEGLSITQPDLLGNDATIVGELEPTTYVRDYFIGNGTTLGFYLSRTPFSKTTVTVFEEEYAGPGLSPTLWYVVDLSGKVSVSGGQLQINGGPATVGLVEQIELAGGIRIQHGQVTFSGPSSGTLGGIYSGSITDGNCLAGFRITPSGGNSAIQALINGTSTGAALVTQPGHQYELATQLFANEAHRVNQTYCSSAHAGANGRGGDTIAAAMRVVLSVHDVDPNNPGTLALPATVLFDDVLATAPSFANYATVNGADLHAQVAYTRLQEMVNVEVRSMIPGEAFRTRLAGALADGGECYISTAGELHFYPPYPPEADEQIVVSYRGSARAIARVQDTGSIASHAVGGDAGRRSFVKRMKVPKAQTSIDCENAALALLDDTVQPAWTGEYSIVSDCLPVNDVLPGDAVQVAAPSRHASFTAIVREVDVQVASLAYDRSEYAIRFANDAAALLAIEFSKATLPDPLPAAFTTSGPSSSLFMPDLTAVQVTDVIATEITVDTGTPPPTGGGIEVRRSDGGWGPTSDGNLVGRYTNRSIGLPRLSRVQEYLLRQYDGSSPAKYSRRSALVHVDYPY